MEVGALAMVRSKLNDPRPMPHKKSAKRWHASPRMLLRAAASVATARVMLVATRGMMLPMATR